MAEAYWHVVNVHLQFVGLKLEEAGERMFALFA
jgi:hypothetical protein